MEKGEGKESSFAEEESIDFNEGKGDDVVASMPGASPKTVDLGKLRQSSLESNLASSIRKGIHSSVSKPNYQRNDSYPIPLSSPERRDLMGIITKIQELQDSLKASCEDIAKTRNISFPGEVQWEIARDFSVIIAKILG